jgi:hypothetical protein
MGWWSAQFNDFKTLLIAVLPLVELANTTKIVKSPMSLIIHLRPKSKSIATNCLPDVVSDLPYDFKKMLESCPQVASQPL